MTTRSIADALANTAHEFPFLGKITAQDLLDIVRMELGHEDILDGFAPYGKHQARAFAPETILHIVSGNTPHAALQSLIRCLLLNTHNLVKIPRTGLREVEEFTQKLPAELQAKVEIATELTDAWITQAGAVIVFGSDETIHAIRSRVPASKPFFAHGHRVSFGIVYEDPTFASTVDAAQDASLFDQQGCLSPHIFYIREQKPGDAIRYAGQLAKEMEAFQEKHPRGALSAEEAAEIFHLRTSYRFRAANDVRVACWESVGNDAWTVIYEDDPWFVASCLNRVVYVKPLPDNLETFLTPVRQWLGAIGIWPCEPRFVENLATLGASRICAIGQMQSPPFTWHQENSQTLANLVHWVDFEPSSPIESKS
ncbi:MAG: acyl-CoA reductase [Chthoniobacterales bacterium]